MREPTLVELMVIGAGAVACMGAGIAVPLGRALALDARITRSASS